MKWKKLGLIFCPTGEKEWMRSHAAVPIAEHIENDLFRVYFSTRDSRNRSYTAFVILDINRPQQILQISDRPVLSPGGLGEFDDSGAMASWLVRKEKSSFLYYIGWNLGVTVPFRNSIGLAISHSSLGQEPEYKCFARGPIIDRSLQEPHFCASCAVMVDEDFWRMWYLSCSGWRIEDGQPIHSYHIKYAESKDGIYWKREGHIAIDYLNEEEYAISRPSVLKTPDGWKMWYSFRGQSYRIGYAESADGRNWIRKDSIVGIDVSPSGWDAEMIEYPFVFDHKGQRFMLYNGNNYGRTGFGLAVLEGKSEASSF
jgi:hypothetical protein